MFKKNLILLNLIFFFSSGAQSATTVDYLKAGWNKLNNQVVETWQTPDHIDIYVPLLTWHNRFTYDSEHIDRYNERPWGAGLGISHYDSQDNWNGLYLMAFKDSFNRWEPIGGYGWEATWRPLQDQRFHIGAGYTLGVTMRHNWDYKPAPVLLPLVSLGYGPANFQLTYVPGSYNNGNVLFGWLRVSF